MFGVEGCGSRAIDRKSCKRDDYTEQDERTGQARLDHGSSSFLEAIVYGGKKIARHPMWKHPMPGVTIRSAHSPRL
jgi:hypothetical protein